MNATRDFPPLSTVADWVRFVCASGHRADVPPLDDVADAPFNDADGGPLYPEDVGIIMQDDNSSKV